MVKKYIILFLAFLMFSASLGYNLYNWRYNNDYSIISSGLDTEFKQLKDMINNNETTQNILISQVEHIESYVMFQENICFRK